MESVESSNQPARPALLLLLPIAKSSPGPRDWDRIDWGNRPLLRLVYARLCLLGTYLINGYSNYLLGARFSGQTSYSWVSFNSAPASAYIGRSIVESYTLPPEEDSGACR